MIDPGFWHGRRVLVTGHTGFKGGWLLTWLHRLGARVSGLALDPLPAPHLFSAARLSSLLLHDHRTDIRDAAAVRRILSDDAPEIVFHLAAQPLVLQSYRTPVDTFAVNAIGTAILLDACRDLPGLRAIVVVTSDKCYDADAPGPFREGDRLGGRDPYSSSKACAELIADCFRRSFLDGVGVATARAGNVLGGGDWAADRLLPDAARAVLAGAVLMVRQPSAVRPWQHVLDPLHGYLLLAQRLVDDPVRWSGAWNFGPAAADAEPVAAVLDRLAKLWRGRLRWRVEAARATAHETPRLLLDASRARRDLGWAPRLSLDMTLGLAVSAYLAQGDRDTDLLSLLRAQIDDFDIRSHS